MEPDSALILKWLEAMVGDLLDRDHSLRVVRCHFHRAGPRWKIPVQHLKDHLLYLLRDGGIRMVVDDQEYQWQAGDLFWIPAGCRVHARALDPERLGRPVFHVLRFNLSGYTALDDASRHPLVARGSGETQVHFVTLERSLALRRPWLGSSTRACLIGILTRILDEQLEVKTSGHFTPQQLRALDAYVQEHMAHAIGAADLAQALAMSPARLRRCMGSEFGLSPRAWISRERLNHAAKLLNETDLGVELVCERCGYQSMPSFHRLFTREFGMTPKEWRHQSDPSRARSQFLKRRPV